MRPTDPPCKPPFLLGLALVCLTAVAPAEAADPRPRLPVPVEDHRAAAPGLAVFLERLAAAVQKRDAAFVRARVDPGFFCARDFGGLCDEGPNQGLSNFERQFDLEDQETDPEYAGWGWRRLGGLVAALTVGPVSQDDMLNSEAAGKGLVCGPAPPAPAALTAVERFAGEDYWFLWGYVEGTGVRLRAGPGTGAPVLERLSFEAVELTERDALPGPGAPEGWVAGRFVQSFVAARLCYGREADGTWRIKAFIGGGD